MASKMPMTPPMQPSTTASIKNCISTSRAVAPIARRTPISRVRSVTDTNMIFMMPMPPTSRLTAATAPSNAVMICVVEATFSATSAVSRIEKLSSSPSDNERRSRIKSRTSPLRCTRSLCGSMLMRIVADQASRCRIKRNDHKVVLIAPHRCCSLLVKKPHNTAGK